MRVKPDNLDALVKFANWAEFIIDNEPELRHTLMALMAVVANFHSSSSFVTFNRDNCKIGDLTFQLSKKLGPTLECVKARIEKAGSRQELWMKHGYDTKFASHLIRLMLEGQELLLTGEIQFPLKYAPVILDIKNGLFKMEWVLNYAEELEKDIASIEKESPLPSKPRYAEIENMLVGMVREYHGM